MSDYSHSDKYCSDSTNIEDKSCSVYTTHTTLHNKQYNTQHTPQHTTETRKPIQIRMRNSVHEAVSRYCGNDLTLGEFYEKAAILYMQVNPKEYVYLSPLYLDARDKSMDNRVQDMICVDKFEKFVEKLKQLNGALRINHKEELLKLVKESQKVNFKSDRLTSLREEAMSYFEQ